MDYLLERELVECSRDVTELWEVTWRSRNWASTAANHATGASAQKVGSFRLVIMRGGGRGGGGGKFGGEFTE